MCLIYFLQQQQQDTRNYSPDTAMLCLRHIMFNHWRINFRGLDDHTSEKLHVWSPRTATVSWNLKTFQYPGSVGNSLPTNHSWDWWRERQSKGDARWYIIICGLGWEQTEEQYCSLKNFLHVSSYPKLMQDTWPKQQDPFHSGIQSNSE